MINGKSCQEWTFAELISFFKEQSGLSYRQIGKKAGLSERTIISWANGLSKRPRDWRDIAKFANALLLNRDEIECLLSRTGHPTVDELWRKGDEADRNLLTRWRRRQVPNPTPRERKLFGRDSLIEQIKAILLNPPRLCVLTGMGGVGKTALAITIATQLREQFTDGILWANMQESSVDEIVELWANEIGIMWGGISGTHNRINRLRSAVAQRKMLLVLDDADSPLMRNLFPSAQSETAVLITTRSKEVASTLANGTGVIMHLAPLERDSSLQLFTDILGDLNNKEQEAANQIADLLGHLPLALIICIMLCKSRHYKLVQMHARLQKINKRLDMTRRDKSERGAVLAFEQSWEQLTSRQKTTYIALAPFAGRMFTAALFGRITNLSDVDADDVLREFCALSLLDLNEHEFSQHPLLADYSKMKAADTLPTLHHQYAKHCLDEARAHPHEIMTLWLHLMASLQYAHSQTDYTLVQQIIEVLEPHWLRTGRYADARTAYKLLISIDPIAASRTYLMWGIACLEQSASAEAEQYLNRSLQIATEQNDHVGIADSHVYLARVAMENQSWEVADNHLKTAWYHVKMGEDDQYSTQQVGDILYRQARVRYRQGAYIESESFYQQAIRTQQSDNGNHVIDLWRTHMLGADIAIFQGNLAEAEARCLQAEQIAETTYDEAEKANTFFLKAKIERRKKAFAEAQESAEKALALFQKMQDPQSEANALQTLCLIHLDWHQADPNHALTVHIECTKMLMICRTIGYQRGEILALLTQGRIAIVQNDRATACQLWKTALSLIKTTPFLGAKQALELEITQHCGAM